MNEFIDKLIGRLEEKANQTWLVLAERNGYERAIEIVNQLAEEYKGGWILCSRELPPQPKENPAFDNKALELYLVSDGYSDYPFRAFWNGKFFVDGFSSVDVIAWMPLPEPFTPKEGRK